MNKIERSVSIEADIFGNNWLSFCNDSYQRKILVSEIIEIKNYSVSKKKDHYYLTLRNKCEYDIEQYIYEELIKVLFTKS